MKKSGINTKEMENLHANLTASNIQRMTNLKHLKKTVENRRNTLNSNIANHNSSIQNSQVKEF